MVSMVGSTTFTCHVTVPYWFSPMSPAGTTHPHPLKKLPSRSTYSFNTVKSWVDSIRGLSEPWPAHLPRVLAGAAVPADFLCAAFPPGPAALAVPTALLHCWVTGHLISPQRMPLPSRLCKLSLPWGKQELPWTFTPSCVSLGSRRQLSWICFESFLHPPMSLWTGTLFHLRKRAWCIQLCCWCAWMTVKGPELCCVAD